MRNKYIVVLLAGVLVSLISCQTTPVPAEIPPAAAEPAPPAPIAEPAPPREDPERGPPGEAEINALNAARALAGTSRDQARDIGSPRYFGGEWEAAEEVYRSLNEGAPATLGEFRAAAEAYRAAAETYDDLARKSLPRYAADREAEIREARQGAIDAGAPEITPERLGAADAQAEQAASQYEAGAYYDAASSAFTAVDMYTALEIGLGAYADRREILEHDFEKYEPINFAFAEELGRDGIASYDAGFIDDARDKAEQAALWYSLVLDIGWETFASERGAAVAEIQEAAYALKAHVAVKRDYDAAAAVLKEGDVLFSQRQFPEAVTRYGQAESLFFTVRDTAREKRRLAEEAIREAEAKVAQSDENARDAEIILEGDTL